MTGHILFSALFPALFLAVPAAGAAQAEDGAARSVAVSSIPAAGTENGPATPPPEPAPRGTSTAAEPAVPVLKKGPADRGEERRAEEELRRLRSLLLAYYRDHNGTYPADPLDLLPGDRPLMPELELPGHSGTRTLRLVRGAGGEIGQAVSDSGGWLYFADPASPYFGMLTLDCSHKDMKGREFYEY